MTRRIKLHSSVLTLAAMAAVQMSFSTLAHADGFTGVAAGDATSNAAVIWTRLDDGTATHTGVVGTFDVQLSTDKNVWNPVLPGASNGTAAFAANHDYTYKTDLTGLNAATQYYYRFVSNAPGNATSAIGTFKTAPAANAAAPVRLAFSGDANGSWRPYGLTKDFATTHLDAFVFLGDTMYETASGGTGPNKSLAAVVTTTAAATPGTLLTDYQRKYREQFIPVITSPTPSSFAGLSTLFQSQGNYTLLDNHELGNKQYQAGGAAPGATVAGPGTGAGVSASSGANDVNTSGTFMNKTDAFKNLVQAYSDYQPIRDIRTTPSKLLSTPADTRADGTQQMYFNQQWGQHVAFFNVDDRSYRDIRITNAGGDDAGPRANAAGRTMLGATQLTSLEQSLLNAQVSGTKWKVVAVSSPIDQNAPIPLASGQSSLATPGGPSAGNAPADAPSLPAGSLKDGGKSWIGGYRAERNHLLKFIADNQISNVIFLSTDDHQNRVNELSYFDPAHLDDQSTAQRVPGAFTIVAGPLGADGAGSRPNDHDFNHITAEANYIAGAQTVAGIDPSGLDKNFPGLHNVFREKDPNLAGGFVPQNQISPVDFYSPDTFNYTTLDFSPDGQNLTVTTMGIDSYGAEVFPDPASLPSARAIAQFSITATPEPGSLVMLVFGTSAMMLRRRRSH